MNPLITRIVETGNKTKPQSDQKNKVWSTLQTLESTSFLNLSVRTGVDEKSLRTIVDDFKKQKLLRLQDRGNILREVVTIVPRASRRPPA